MDPNLVVDEEMEPDPELNRITNRIIGAAIEVHKELGPGHSEATYENALAIEFNRQRIHFERQVRYAVFYKGEQVGEGRMDFLVEGRVLLELKAVETMTSLFTSQVISYLKATKHRLGLLINFNVRRLADGIKRIAY